MTEEQSDPEQGQAETMTEEEAQKKQRNQILSALSKMENANRETMKQLQMRGKNPDGLMMTRLRLEVLISALLGNQDSIQRLQFEMVWQRELQEYLSSLYKDGNKKKLHIPGAN